MVTPGCTIRVKVSHPVSKGEEEPPPPTIVIDVQPKDSPNQKTAEPSLIQKITSQIKV